MSDYSEICLALERQLRTVFEKANQKNFKEAIDEAQFLDALSGNLIKELRNQLGK
jgi:hypothetical protein